MSYSIDTIAKLVGLSSETLRNWEKRYGFLNPKKAANGFRVYSEQDLQLLRRITQLMSQGVRIGDIASTLAKHGELPHSESLAFEGEVGDLAEKLYAALLRFDQEKADFLMSLVENKVSAEKLLEEVLSVLLRRLGEDWASKRANIAQEHFASAFVRARLSAYLSLYRETSPANRRHAVLATVAGELHEGGALLVAAFLKLAGWAVTYLGPGVPGSELKDVCESLRPDVLCLSFAMPELASEELARLSRMQVPVVVGGRGVQVLENLKVPSWLAVLSCPAAQAPEQLDRLLRI